MGKDEEKTQAQSAEGGGETQAQNQSDQSGQQAGQQQTKKIIDVAGAEETIIAVDISGEYSELLTFLRNMKKLSRFNIIKDLSIQETTGDNITASFAVIIFSKSS